MIDQRETICALATPPGTAGLAVVRVSGAEALTICGRLFKGRVDLSDAAAHTIHYGWWGDSIDSVTTSVFRAPHSYTGEDVVEIGCHGGLFVVDQIIDSLTSAGARVAEAGEFTRRAFLNNKLDLTQVEAVADVIHAQTRAGAQTAARQLAGGFTRRLSELRQTLLMALGYLEVELDFSEEGYEFVSRPAFLETLRQATVDATRLAASAQSAHILRSGFYCAVVGYPNAGKSSLFNALLGRPRAIVSHIAGTTRDYLEESIVEDGYTIHLYDTAGLRSTEDTIELQGIQVTSSLIEQSNLVLVVNDASLGFRHSDALIADIQSRYPTVPIAVVQNKSDLSGTGVLASELGNIAQIPTTALSEQGVSELRAYIAAICRESTAAIHDVLINQRQAHLLRVLIGHLEGASGALAREESPDLIAIDLRSAVRVLGEITGETWNPDLLDTVFSRFCIGK
ncbi:MAG: tRNA uridine-5-carboxymethylaminomethyl(34) synthesis GTPase MnmE [Candidatus Kapaibacteriota bacterium]